MREPGATERHVAFPPGWRHIKVPTSSRAAARAAIALYAPCRAKGLLARRVAWHAVGLAGPRVLGTPGRWDPPLDGAAWEALVDALGATAGPFDTFAVYERPQQARAGFALLLLRAGEARAFARVRLGAAGRFDHEAAVLTALTRTRPRAFWHPEPLGHADGDGWEILCTTAHPPMLHRPDWDADLTAVTAEIQIGLAEALPRPEGCPADWAPMHGDLTPWNLRVTPHGRRMLVDWEDAAWGPAGADEVLFRASAAALRATPPAPGPPEAVRHWLARLEERVGAQTDPLTPMLRDALLAMLDS